MKIEVTYMSGAGNTFSVIDNSRCGLSKAQASELAGILCFKNNVNHHSTEGLILIDLPTEDDCDFSADFFNPDGTCDAMCGNGGRCAVRFASLMPNINLKSNGKFSMAEAKYCYTLPAGSDLICLHFPAPLAYKDKFFVIGESAVYSGTYVDVGTRHYILDFNSTVGADDFTHYNINSIAREIRYANEFAPHGVNVNFFRIENGTVYLRTYERGVEFETGACGTGAISTAIAIVHNKLLDFPVKIVPTSGLPLYVDSIGTKLHEEYSLTGPAEIFDKQSIETNLFGRNL